MAFIQNFPFFSIMLPMVSGVISSVLSGKKARALNLTVDVVILCLTAATLRFVAATGESYGYMMGHFPAPWGNEIRIGTAEALLALVFAGVILLSVTGGMAYIRDALSDRDMKLYCIFLNLLMGSVLAMIYTNDLFTGYVFIEINTIASCGLMVAKKNGPSYVSATRYMIMALVGSSLFLLGVCMLYTVTGHLLMENIHDSVAAIAAAGTYAAPMTVLILLMTGGLAIKSGLFPFHSWMPGAYGFSLPSSSAILSGVVSKIYIFLLIKVLWRVLGIDVVRASGVLDVIFVFAVCAILGGSLLAIRERDIRYMNAYSSVAQIGYVYLGVSMGTAAGLAAALFHMLMHSVTKSLLFLSTEELSQVSGHTYKIRSLTGAGHRAKISGVGFAVGAFSMVGIPLFAGFISKLALATAAADTPGRLVPVLLVLAVSTLLNVAYFVRTVIILYTPGEGETDERPAVRQNRTGLAAILVLIALNFALGLFSGPVLAAIEQGIAMFV